MSSYRQILYHIVFRTKNGELVITPAHAKELYAYIWGIIKVKNSVLYQLNGMPDHIHILSDLHPSISLSDYIKDIKVASSIWMKKSGLFPYFTGWAEGYGAFTYSLRDKEMICNYIKKQQAHHATFSFRDELKNLLEEHGITFDEKYL